MKALAGCVMVAAALLAGCASPDPTYYSLLPAPGAAAPVAFRTLEVRRPGLAGYLDRSDLVLVRNGYAFRTTDQVRWSQPLGDMIGQVLAQNLAQRLPGTSVFTEGGAITADPDARIEVDINRFDADAGGPVVLEAQFAVERGLTHSPLAAAQLALRAPAGAGAGGLAAAMSTLLGELADRVAGSLRGSAGG